MTFTADQVDQLSAKLDKSKVKSRQQGRANVSYIEGWWAIAEANRIFGFDGWNREAVEIKQLTPVYENHNGNKVANYFCKVRVTVGDIIREGCGFGSGIDKDEGQAHESAIKEAETDAMKRALMTFGNPFGLALYDKDQKNVETPPQRKNMAFVRDGQITPQEWTQKVCDAIRNANADELQWINQDNAEPLDNLQSQFPDLWAKIEQAVIDRKAALKG